MILPLALSEQQWPSLRGFVEPHDVPCVEQFNIVSLRQRQDQFGGFETERVPIR